MTTALACPACRTGLLARRGDALCPSCVKAARELTSWPLWIFDSPLLRQALAEVNLPAVPAIVRAACGLSQRDLAGLVGWSAAALSYYERGRRDGMFDVRALLLFADTVGMPRAALLPLVFADPEAGAESGAADSDEHRHGRPGDPAAWQAAASLAPGVNGSHVRYWRACTDTLYVRARAVGGGLLLSPALRLWQRVRLAVRDRGPVGTGDQLLAVAGDLALCAGWVALDAGRLQLARHLQSGARQLVAGAGDAVLAVHTLADESGLFAEMACAGQSRELAQRALRLAFQAQEEGRYLAVPRLHALIALRHAAASALLGDRTAFQKAISQARRQLADGPRDENPASWLRFVDDTEITATEAAGYLDLNEASRSVLLYRQVLATCLSARDRASCNSGLACALVAQGMPGEAIAVATEALAALETGITAVRCLGQLRQVRQAAGNGQGAREFGDRLDAAEHNLPAHDGRYCEEDPGRAASIPALRQADLFVGSDANWRPRCRV